jgi:hypothetical protein
MIQRYNIFNNPTVSTNYIVKQNDNGEWVKWDDIKHLMPFQEEIEKYLEKDAKIILNGNPNAEKPKGIINGGLK